VPRTLPRGARKASRASGDAISIARSDRIFRSRMRVSGITSEYVRVFACTSSAAPASLRTHVPHGQQTLNQDAPAPRRLSGPLVSPARGRPRRRLGGRRRRARPGGGAGRGGQCPPSAPPSAGLPRRARRAPPRWPATETRPALPVPGGPGAMPATRRSATQSERPSRALTSLIKKNRRRPTLPGPCGPSTIGAEGLNCSVRNGKRCFPLAKATEKGRETKLLPVLQNCTAPQGTTRPSRANKKSVKPSNH
jgi:hypothetical protein